MYRALRSTLPGANGPLSPAALRSLTTTSALRGDPKYRRNDTQHQKEEDEAIREMYKSKREEKEKRAPAGADPNQSVNPKDKDERGAKIFPGGES
ncbi:hypothetical protein AAVH_23740 [Aphelenchoides avenae]|nr:hypothetical protein AAVH_23740 [Aphelenchus avenae]